MILDCCHFQYGDFNSRTFGLIFVHLDTGIYTSLMGEISSTYIFNQKNKTRSIAYDDYKDSPISFEAEIMSDNFEAFSLQEKKIIEKALFNKPIYQKLYIDIEDDYGAETYEYVNGYLKRLYFNCRFINPSKIEDGNGCTMGYKFTIECDSCMMWQELTDRQFTLEGGTASTSVIVDVDTEIGDYTYPTITAQVGNVGGSVKIVNNTDDSTRITGFTDLTPNSSFIMKGDTNFISGQSYEKFTSPNFVRLLDGENNIIITGDLVSIKFEWNNRRFV